ncbi:MAG: ArnT family glycosyltransferase [Candidatus Puniceispirillales bacterium]
MLSFSQKSTAAGMIIFMIIIMVTLLRCYALFVSPLDLSVDEAQYWLWSQTPDAGYFTKPPMIAWVISIGTNLAGAGESGIRLMAPLLHGMTAVILWQIAAYLYHPVAGRLVALGWISLPAVGLASFVMSTDTPLLLFTSTMILVLSPLAVGRSISITGYSLAGIMLGLGFLSKYAAIYSLISIALIWIFQPQIRRLMRWPQWGVLLLSALIVVSPNIIWNWQNGFATVAHLEHNANIAQASLSFISGLNFLLSQAGVVGPVLFLAAIMAMGAGGRHTGFLSAFILPPLIIITIQAMISDANANWAILAWPPALILIAGWLCDQGGIVRRSWWLAGIGASNVALAGLLWVISMTGTMGALTPASDPLRHLRGWDGHHADIMAFMQNHPAHTIITDRRVTTALLMHKFRDTDINIRIYDADLIPSNHYEAYFRFTPTAENSTVILVTENSQPLDIPGIIWTDARTVSQSNISDRYDRILHIHAGMYRSE